MDRKKMKMKKSKIVVGLMLCVYILSFANVSALPVYGGVEVINPRHVNNASVLENGLSFVKPYENEVSAGSSLSLVGSSNGSISDGFLAELMFDYKSFRESVNYENVEFVMSIAGVYNFAGTFVSFAETYKLLGNGKCFRFIRYDIYSFSETYDTFESDIFIIRFQHFMGYDSANSINHGCIITNVYEKNYTSNEVQYNGTLSYSDSGYSSAGSCSMDSYEYSFYYNNIAIWGSSETKLLKSTWLMAYRALYATISDFYDFPNIPLIYTENLNAKPLEVINPELSNYWEYNSYILENSYAIPYTFEREYAVFNDTTNETETRIHAFDFEFTTLKVAFETRKYYYSTRTIDPDSWGTWQIPIWKGWFGTTEYSIDFNWLRNFFVWTVNSIIFLFQAILYLLIIGFNFLLLQPLFWVIVLIWNHPVQWVFVGIIGVVFWITFFFVWLWNELTILWKQIIEPLLNWIWNETVAILRFIYNWLFKEGGLQTLVNLYLTLVSYILAIIFFVLTAGLINFTETQQAMAIFLIQLNSIFFQIGSIFISNFPLLIGYSGVYILLVGLVYLKYIYAKARGYTQRATKLQSMINVYKLPMVLLIRLSQYIIGFIQGGVPTDGADE